MIDFPQNPVTDIRDVLIARQQDRIAQLEKQRDELLAAAEAVEIDAEECNDFDDCIGMFIPIGSYHKLMETIENVKGGAA